MLEVSVKVTHYLMRGSLHPRAPPAPPLSSPSLLTSDDSNEQPSIGDLALSMLHSAYRNLLMSNDYFHATYSARNISDEEVGLKESADDE